MDRDDLVDRFRNTVVPLADLTEERARRLASRVEGRRQRGDDALRSRSDFSRLFDVLHEEFPGATGIELDEPDGGRSAAGRVVDHLEAKKLDKAALFACRMFDIGVEGWPADQLEPLEPVMAPRDAMLALSRTDPADAARHPAPGPGGVLLGTTAFSLVNTGNRTLLAPKRSWRVELQEEDAHENRLAGLRRFNLKSMYNDPSQLREAMAWRTFMRAGVPAPRHTFAKFSVNGRYRGLFSFIEQLDAQFINERFGKNDEGNLYKAYCGDLGCATLEHRTGADGDDSGVQYRSEDPTDETYSLKTNEDTPAADTHHDLARFIRVVNGIGSAGGDDRDTAAYRSEIERIFNVWPFLRWASVNVLLGSWDNYFATPSNYYLYNSGFKGEPDAFVEHPYFTFIPWDYDNSLGVDYFGTQWQYTDLLDWPANTRAYWKHTGGVNRTSRIPLVQNILANTDFRRYYLDHIEFLLDAIFTPEAFEAQLLTGPDPLWPRVAPAAYLESDTPHGNPFTGRRFSNHEVYMANALQHEIQKGDQHVDAVIHYVRMRRDRAMQQLGELRAAGETSGLAGRAFPVAVEELPERSPMSP